tara:strand:- start:17 stop:190 length:174 start_codon:yes stop_codon:yes gene_type:complete
MKTRIQAIRTIEKNAYENDRNLAEGRITSEQHDTRVKDGKRALNDIMKRPPFYWLKK